MAGPTTISPTVHRMKDIFFVAWWLEPNKISAALQGLRSLIHLS